MRIDGVKNNDFEIHKDCNPVISFITQSQTYTRASSTNSRVYCFRLIFYLYLKQAHSQTSPPQDDALQYFVEILQTKTTAMKKSTFLLASCMLFLNTVSFSQAGSLDSTFGINGKVITKASSGDAFGYSVAIQADRKIVVAGYVYNGLNNDFALVRYERSGKRDINFGYNGKASTDFGWDDLGHSVAIQADGKIVVAGNSNGDFALVRYKANGAPDSTFGKNGKVITAVGAYGEAYSVSIQADGKIVVAGFCDDGGIGSHFALTRYKINGRLDSSFGANGIAISDFSGYGGYSAAIQPDGKIVVAGAVAGEFGLARYKINGKPDSSFGVNGKVITEMYYGTATSVAVQADGKIVAGGFSWWEYGSNFEVMRYNPNGDRDISFGANGRVSGGSETVVTSIALQPDGKIVVAGGVNDQEPYSCILARYKTNGIPDSSFGLNGEVVTNFEIGTSDFYSSVAIQADGKIVAAGPSKLTYYRGGVARYNGDNTSKRDNNFSNLHDQNSAPSNIRLSPNPVKDVVHIEGLSSSPKTISIIDVNGKLVQQISTADRNYSFNIKQLSAGIYFVRVDDGEKTATLKFIKD
jgi:uncharacterized delta-60 repeat protein